VPRPHTAMRKIRDVLRLSLGEQLSQRRVAVASGLPRTTVNYLRRAEAAGLEWPLPEDMDDAALEAQLFASSASPQQSRPLPEWGKVHKELRKPHVTLMLVWLEYKETHPDGYAYSQFAELYRRWRRQIDAVMHHEHKAGEKLFVDFPGDTIAIYDDKTAEVSMRAEFRDQVVEQSRDLVAVPFSPPRGVPAEYAAVRSAPAHAPTAPSRPIPTTVSAAIASRRSAGPPGRPL